MCPNRADYSKVNSLHELCLRKLSFEALLEKDGSVSICNKNLSFFATEMD